MLSLFKCCQKKKTHHKGPTILIESKDSELIEPPPSDYKEGEFGDPRSQRANQSLSTMSEVRLQRTESFSPKSDRRITV